MQGNTGDRVWEELSRRVEALVGSPLPPKEAFSSPGFDALLRAVRERDPGLWRQILDAITGPDVRLPVEEEARSDEIRERVRRRLIGPFLRPDALRTGMTRLDRRKAVSYAMIGLTAVALVWSAVGPRRVSAPAPQVMPQIAGQGVAGVERQVRPAAPPGPGQAGTRPAAEEPVPRLPVQEPPAERRPMRASGQVQAGFLLPPPAAEVPAAPPAVPPGAGTAPRPVTATGMSDPVVFRSESDGKATSPLVFRREREGEEGRGETVHGAGTREAAGARDEVVVYRAGAHKAAGSQGGAVVYRAAAAAESRQGAAVIVAGRKPETGEAARPGPQEGTGSGSPEAGTARSSQEIPEFRLGQVLQAKLVLPVSVSPAWGPVPVVAEIADGKHKGLLLWGQARMGRDGSIEIGFTQLITTDGKTYPFNGVAYDASAGRPGVQGQVQTVMPSAMQSLLNTTLQAASEYFKAKVESKTVTITNGFVTIRQKEPSFFDVFSKSLAEAVSPVTRQVTGPTVVARLPAGAVIGVIVMGQ